MAWVVDTCLVIDVLDDDPQYGEASATLLDSKADENLVLCPVSYVELAPAFLEDLARQDEFLRRVGIDVDIGWLREDTVRAHRGWAHYAELKRSQSVTNGPLPTS